MSHPLAQTKSGAALRTQDVIRSMVGIQGLRRPTLHPLTLGVGLLSLLLVTLPWSVAGAADPLPTYNVALDDVSVSGISSGAYMAVQMGVAHSKIVSGVGVFAGGPYRCAAGSVSEALGTCMQGEPDVERAVAETARAAATGRIDAPENLARQRIWLFSGYNDGVLKQSVMDRLRDYYLRFVPPGQVYYQDTLDAGHAVVTLSYGEECPATGGEFINDCDYDGAGLLLQHVYGRLEPPAGAALGGQFVTFDQDAFVPGDSRSKGMAREAFLYVPAACAAGERCRSHVAFHGCQQNAEEIGDAFYRHAGYNEWADTNRIIVLYPQTVASTLRPFNPKGCWDWWGYNGPDYAAKGGAQIAAVHAMLTRLAEGAGAPAPAAPQAGGLQLEATDASATSVSLAWHSAAGASAYAVYRAQSDAGPFARLTDPPVAHPSFADHGLEPGTRYFYQVRPVNGGIEDTPTGSVAITTRAEAPPCDPYFTDNVTHTTRGRATAWWGFTFAKSSWDYMGLWTIYTESTLYRDGNAYQVGVCP